MNVQFWALCYALAMKTEQPIPTNISGLGEGPEAVLVPEERKSAPRLSAWKRFFGHLGTITHHKIEVGKLCFRAGLIRQGLLHDLSKYAPSEFLIGVHYYQGWRSPNAAERDELGYSTAWLHHKGRNRHHFEYWTDIIRVSVPYVEGEPPRTVLTWKPLPMPKRFVVEMFCDRIAASKVYLKDAYTDESPLVYFRREMGSCPELMHPDTLDLIERLLTILAHEGEDAAFAYIRSSVLKRGGANDGR